MSKKVNRGQVSRHRHGSVALGNRKKPRGQKAHPHSSKGSKEPWLPDRFALFILLLLPWIVFWVIPSWPFQGVGAMDPWYYFGEFIHFPRYERLNPNYAGERLPWILPGYVFIHLFSAPNGVLLLHICFYSIATFSIYSVVKKFTNVRTALLTSCLMGCHVFFLSANGWTYVDGACLAYLSLSFALLTRALFSQKTGIWIFLSGVAWGALIYTYVMWLILTPACALFYIYLSAETPVSWYKLRVLVFKFFYFFAAGLLALTLLLSLCFGSFFAFRFFFYSNLSTALAFSHMREPLIKGGYEWVKSASWIVFPVITFLAAIGLLVLQKLKRVTLSRSALAILMVYIYCFVVAVVMTVRNNRLLELDYCADILVPVVFAVLGISILKVPARLNNFSYWTLLISSCALCVTPLASHHVGAFMMGLALPYAIGIAGLGIRLLFPASAWAWAFCLGSLAFASLGLGPEGLPAWRTLTDGGDALMRRVESAIEAINRRVPSGRIPVFWIDDYTDPMTTDYRSIMCGFVTHGVSMWHFPNVTKRQPYPPNTFLIMITRQKDVFAEANATITRAGMPLSFVAQDHIGQGEQSYWITYTRVLSN